MVVHHIPPENLATFIVIYVAFTFFYSTTPSFHIARKKFLETELEVRNNKEIFPFFTTYHFSIFQWFHLHSNSVGHNWYTAVTAEN